MDETEAAATMEAALRRQGDRTAAWNGGWGDVLEAGREKGLLSNEQARQYAQQSVVFDLGVREQVVAGETLAVWLDMESRVGSGTQLGMALEVREVTFAGRPVSNIQQRVEWAVADRGEGRPETTVPRFLRHVMLSSPDVHGRVAEHAPRLAPAVAPEPAGWRVNEAPGTYRLRLSADVSVFPSVFDVRSGSGRALATWTESFETDVSVFDSGEAGIALATDPALTRQMSEAFEFTSLLVRRNTAPNTVVLNVQCATVPSPFAFELWLRDGERTWYAGDLSGHPADRGFTTSVVAYIDNFDFRLDRVDLVLKPSPRVARSAPDLEEIWGEAIVITNVPCRKQR